MASLRLPGGSAVVHGGPAAGALTAASSGPQGYASFNTLWKQQGAVIDKLPEHFKGELLAGLAMSAQQTGHKDEAVLYADKIIALIPDTAYGSRGKAMEGESRRRHADDVQVLPRAWAIVRTSCGDQGRELKRSGTIANDRERSGTEEPDGTELSVPDRSRSFRRSRSFSVALHRFHRTDARGPGRRHRARE